MVFDGFRPSPWPEVCRDAAEAGWDSCRSGTQPITEYRCVWIASWARRTEQAIPPATKWLALLAALLAALHLQASEWCRKCKIHMQGLRSEFPQLGFSIKYPNLSKSSISLLWAIVRHLKSGRINEDHGQCLMPHQQQHHLHLSYLPQFSSTSLESPRNFQMSWMERSPSHSRQQDLTRSQHVSVQGQWLASIPRPAFAKSKSVSLAAERSDTPSPA